MAAWPLPPLEGGTEKKLGEHRHRINTTWTLIFFSLLFLREKQGGPPQKARIFLSAERLKSLGKKGQSTQKARKFRSKKQGNSLQCNEKSKELKKKQGKGDQRMVHLGAYQRTTKDPERESSRRQHHRVAPMGCNFTSFSFRFSAPFFHAAQWAFSTLRHAPPLSRTPVKHRLTKEILHGSSAPLPKVLRNKCFGGFFRQEEEEVVNPDNPEANKSVLNSFNAAITGLLNSRHSPPPQLTLTGLNLKSGKALTALFKIKLAPPSKNKIIQLRPY